MTTKSIEHSFAVQLDALDRAARKYRHGVHGRACNCRPCVELLKALASLDYAGYDFSRRARFHAPRHRATPMEVAKTLGVPARRARQLIRDAKRMIGRKGR